MENKVLKRFIDDGRYYDFNYKFENGISNATEQEFTKYAHEHIDLFVKQLCDSMCEELGYNINRILLCKSIQNVLKENLYNNNDDVFSFFNNIFHIASDSSADYGLWASFSFAYEENLTMLGNDLVIQIVFGNPQQCEDLDVFQIRCHYNTSDDIYNENFNEYFESDGFLTTDSYLEYWECDDDEECYDNIGISIVKLSYCNLYGNLYNRKSLEDNINEFYEDMSKVISE